MAGVSTLRPGAKEPVKTRTLAPDQDPVVTRADTFKPSAPAPFKPGSSGAIGRLIVKRKGSVAAGGYGEGGAPAGVPQATVQRAITKASLTPGVAALDGSGPTPITAAPAVKVTPSAPIKLDTSGLEGEFAAARSRAAGRENAAVQAQRDAIARRAAMGGGGISGALQKQESLAMDASAQRLGETNAEIDAAKAGELRKARDLEQQLNFQAQQNDIQRQYAADEAAAGRQSAADALNADLALKDRAMKVQQSQFTAQMNQAFEAFDWEKHIDEKNLEIAARIQALNEQEDPGLLGMGGLLGTGIGGRRGILTTGILAS